MKPRTIEHFEESINTPVSSLTRSRAAISALFMAGLLNACHPGSGPKIGRGFQYPDNHGVQKKDTQVLNEFDLLLPRQENDNEPNMTIVGMVPDVCAFTGIVLEHDTYSDPHRVLLEHMCVKKVGGIDYPFEGQHRWASADKEGDYEIPFHGAHLEKGEEDTLFFVLEHRNGERIAEPLTPSQFVEGAMSFAPSLKRHHVRAIEE